MSHAYRSRGLIPRVFLGLLLLGLLLTLFGGARLTGSAKGAAPPTKYTFKASARLPYATDEAESAVVGSVLYLFGGFNLNNRRYQYEPTTRSFAYDGVTGRSKPPT